jgi:hypothetical protein
MACGLWAASPDSFAQDPPTTYVLAYKFQAGEDLRWDVVHQATVQTTIQGTTQSARTKSESVKAWHVTGVSPEGEIEFVHSVERVRMTNELPNRAPLVYDSQQDDPPPREFAIAAAAVGVPLSVIHMTPQGKVLNREEKHPQPQMPPDALITIPLPEQPIALGQEWTVPHEVPVPANGGQRLIQTRQRFILENVQNGVATIRTEYQILTPLRDPAIEARLVQRLANGTIQFDIESGRIVSQQAEVDKRVVGFSGASSSMHYRMQLTEQLQDAKLDVASQIQPDAGLK